MDQDERNALTEKRRISEFTVRFMGPHTSVHTDGDGAGDNPLLGSTGKTPLLTYTSDFTFRVLSTSAI